ncbi:GNAT family N-acetyltransferase [Streptomyces sp. LP11]|uniref:GNAT family N-acetyltransferase n=1 Tax=Streptomyces pyxinicus TaxID=2970331 RepID=A0ABT2AVZ9_9ACTN|nr:GNAT family N-acetyltransferase [Streptomyces sp. LP11]MCS0600412.1 GNAT family N-acetyltransferase [Streptomyces sp. LP11]
MSRVRLARASDLPGFLGLAAEVEHWFGPMVDDPAFHAAVLDRVRASQALVVPAPDAPGLLGGLLFGGTAPVHEVHWLVVAERARGEGVGRALPADALRRYVSPPATVEVVTFGPDDPGAVASGARVFYETLGFTPAEPTAPGPEGGSRQLYRRTVA